MKSVSVKDLAVLKSWCKSSGGSRLNVVDSKINPAYNIPTKSYTVSLIAFGIAKRFRVDVNELGVVYSNPIIEYSKPNN